MASFHRCAFKVSLYCTVFFQGCNTAKELNPQSSEIPVNVAEIITNKYPAASGIVAKPLISKKTWEFNFTQYTSRYTSVVSNTTELANIRELSATVPDSLNDLLIRFLPGGGELADFKEIQQQNAFGGPNYTADYEWNASSYIAQWDYNRLSKGTVEISMVPTYRLRYFSYDMKELPENIQAIVNNEYFPTGTGTAIYIQSERGKTFVVGDEPGYYNMNAQMIINESGGVLYSEMGSLDFVDKLENFPEKIQSYVRKHPIGSLVAEKNVVGYAFSDKGFSGYRVMFHTTATQGSEFSLYFNSGGDLVWEHYYGRIW